MPIRYPLHAAISAGDEEAVERLLTQDPALSRAENELRQTPLHYVAARKTLDTGSFKTIAVQTELRIAERLIAAGADVNAPDRKGRTPLHLTLFWYFYPLAPAMAHMASLLLTHGADPNAGDEDGNTPLHYAATRDAGLAQLLLDHGALPNKDNRDGRTPLHLAAANGSREIVSVLLKRGANKHIRDFHDETPFR